jgi:hypothetical protein
MERACVRVTRVRNQSRIEARKGRGEESLAWCVLPGLLANFWQMRFWRTFDKTGKL